MQRILLAVVCASLLLGYGCQSNEPELTGQERMNRQKLQIAPFAVTESFQRDFPKATITSAKEFTDSSGRTVYHVNYVRSGQTGQATYSPTGERLAPTELPAK